DVVPPGPTSWYITSNRGLGGPMDVDGSGRVRTTGLSSGKRLIALSMLALIAFVIAGRLTHVGDATGGATGGAADVATAADVPLSQIGVNALAGQVGHLHVAINFTWLLLTGFLVLFMQVGFALLTTGL